LLIPEKYDGQGLGLSEAVVALTETGRALLPAPVLSSCVLAAEAVLATGDDGAFAELLPALAGGLVVATVAVEDAADTETIAAESAGEWSLTGRKVAVLDGDIADRLLVTAAVGDGTGLFAVRADDNGLRRVADDGIDLLRRTATVDLSAATAVRLGGDYRRGLARLEDVAAVGAAAEQTGVSRRALELAVDYAGQREQFGRPIGSFQAIKHLCADTLAALECSQAAVTAAAAAADDEPDRLPEAAAVAKAYCSRACTDATESLIQVLGGIGYTWEHPAHLLLRRAKALEFLFGDAATHRERLAVLLGLA
jgi:alkylation response protein AidB-like acyl-CoA dehydrogenase